MGLIVLFEPKNAREMGEIAFFYLPYFARGGAISETKQPWHKYRPLAAPNTTNRYPDASNR
jgi:hypothetical protein